jgi:hypothetical protein
VTELNFGDTLDQDYISQQFSKAANREFGKAYYTDLENFFSQGKFEVKTAVSQTPLLQVAGTGVSGSVAGLNPTPQVFYAGQYGISLSSSPRALCGGSFDYVDVYSSNGSIDIGVTVYSDSNGAFPLTGYRSIFDVDSCSWYSVDPSTAVVIGYAGSCSEFSLSCP